MDLRDFFSILRRNFITPVVISLYGLSIALLVAGESRDAWFVSFVISVNTIFACVQEVRSRMALKKLELLNAPFARLRHENGKVEKISFADVRPGQHLELIPGDEIPADGNLIESRGLEVDESILTGESQSVVKQAGDPVYASSTVKAGTAFIEVKKVGEDTKAGVMTSTLKRYAPEVTPLQKTLNRVVTALTFAALAVAVIIFITYNIHDFGIRAILKTITSAGTVIIPEGLILGSTILLAFGSLRLAQSKVLPQKLSAIEGMALLDVLCVDKTGTLTSDKIEFKEVKSFVKTLSDEELMRVSGTAISCIGGGNATSDALLDALPSDEKVKILDTLAFTSQRKLSAVRYKDANGKIMTVMLGAPEFVSQYAPMTKNEKSKIDEFAAQGLRVLLVATFDDKDTALDKLKHGSGKAIGVITLTNKLRSGVRDTVEYLQKRGVSLRVISGDNLKTVQNIAQAAGIDETEKGITGEDLAKLKGKKFEKAVLENTIFARVLPEQKENIIGCLQKHGHYTGMVGDGVNDALAIKKSDLGVVMFSGAAATRRVADIVLLNNSFNSLPIGMRLGNRVMQTMEIIAVLFFHKIIYGLIVLAVTIIMAYQYPFEPRHNTFMNVFMVTMPTLMWTLFPPRPRHRVNPAHFWRDTLLPIAPVAIISGLTVSACYIFMLQSMHLTRNAAGTICVIVATILGISVVFNSSHMLGVFVTKRLMLARLLYIGAAMIMAYIGFGFTLSRNFFDFVSPDFTKLPQAWPVIAMTIGALILHAILTRQSEKRILQRNREI